VALVGVLQLGLAVHQALYVRGRGRERRLELRRSTVLRTAKHKRAWQAQLQARCRPT